MRRTLSDAARDIGFGTAAQGAAETVKNIDLVAESARKAQTQVHTLGAAFAFNQAVQSVREVSGALGELVAVASQYESKLAAVGAITGITGDGLDAIGDRARELAKQFGGSAASQLESFQGILSKLGPQVANNADALAMFGRNVSVLSAASGENAASSMRAITDTMLQFGLVTGDAMRDAETSTQVINALAASAQVGAAEIPQVAEAIVQAGVAAIGARMDFIEANAAIQVLAVGGRTGSEAGVALRNVLSMLQNASGPAAEAMEKLGTSSSELGRLLTEEGLDAALGQLDQGWIILGRHQSAMRC
jgi:TP901 family phage tail tape measure protein